MPSFRIDKARRFLDELLELPLFGQIGESLETKEYIQVKSVDDYVKAMQQKAWDKLIGQNTLNHQSAHLIDVYGGDWFQKHNNDNVERIWDELEKRKIEKLIQKTWKRLGIPEDIDPYIDTVQWAYNFISGAAYDTALGFGEDETFDLKYVKPCLLMGHLPCGWSGKVPGEPKSPQGVSPYAGKQLKDATGDGKLKVF